MAKRFTDSQKWHDPWFDKLSMKYKLLWLYLLDNCDHAGIWKVNMRIASIFVGASFKIMEIKDVFFDRIIEINEEKWYIPKFITFQYGSLNSANRAHNSVIQILMSNGLYDKNKGHTSPIQGYKDKAKDKAKAKDKDMVKDKDKEKDKKESKKRIPTYQEVQEYIDEKKYNIDAEHFFAYYESNGWKQANGNPIQRWKAAVTTWSKNNNKFKNRSFGKKDEVIDSIKKQDLQQIIDSELS